MVPFPLHTGHSALVSTTLRAKLCACQPVWAGDGARVVPGASIARNRPLSTSAARGTILPRNNGGMSSCKSPQTVVRSLVLMHFSPHLCGRGSHVSTPFPQQVSQSALPAVSH